MYWDIENDTFGLQNTIKTTSLTRRAILSTVTMYPYYDPLGFVAAFVLKAKQILRDLREAKCGWDSTISCVYSRPYKKWLTELEQLKHLQISRSLKPEDFGQVKTAQLHHFSDASEQGYGTVSYIRFIDNLGKIHVTLVMGKSRVSPLKRMTIPRLELTAATLVVRVDQMLRSELQLNLEESIFWTDSQSVLKYIYNQNKRFHTFVANRLSVIHDLSKEDQWKYVDSKQNPADDASRGLNIESLLKSKRWLQGPEFLKNEESQGPQNPDEASQNYISLDDPEVKKDAIVNIMIIDVENPVRKLIEYYSDWISLKKTVAWILKIKTLLLEITKRKKINSGLLLGKDKPLKERTEALKVAFNGNLTLEDMENAGRAILVFEQHQHFKQDIALLERGKPCMKDSSILKMDPMLDQGILRVGGRINSSAMPVSIKNPIILPKKSHISEIILKHIHIQIGHSGRNHILSKLGQKYWMPSANSFTSVGMDYFGPF